MLTTSISRRDFLTKAAAATLAFECRSLFAESAGASLTVRTKSGKLRGAQSNGARIFRGVPFAAAPVGALRFRAPAAMKPWRGERDATSFASAAMQSGEPQLTQSEDCLYLNVWAPEGKGPFPVFVWIHGGGFTGGHSFEPTFDGTKFTKEGIVCVTVAYRLGVFGFLDVEPLLGGEYAGSANNALRDLIAALEWVRDNVADFGGDPSRVTVGGESAGAKLTGILMGIPSAQPLFHQMISESGGAERVWPRPNAAAVSIGFAGQWGESSGRDVTALRTSPAAMLIDAQKTFIQTWPQHFPLRAEIDGQLVPRKPIETIAQGSTRGKRLVIGTNRDESASFIGPHPMHDATASDLGNMPLDTFAEVYGHYKDLYPEMTPEQLRIRAVTAEEYWIPSMRVLDAHVSSGGTAYDYRLEFSESSGRMKGYAYHSLDTGMVWDRPHAEVANASVEATLTAQMHAAWTAFIRGEPPAADGLPEWPEYSSDARATMIFDVESHVQQKPLEDELHLWDGVL